MMKSKTVKEFMVPIEAYATVGEDATLMDAVMALEKAQMEFDQTRYRHRAILVLDESNHVIGKISQHDVINDYNCHESTRNVIEIDTQKPVCHTRWRKTEIFSVEHCHRRGNHPEKESLDVCDRYIQQCVLQSRTRGGSGSGQHGLEGAFG